MTSVIDAVFKAFELDPEGASYLVDEAVGNWLLDELEAREPWLQSALAVQVAGVNALAKRALARSYVETMAGGHYPDDEVHKTAQWLAGIDRYCRAAIATAGDVTKAFGRRRERWHLADGTEVVRQVNRDRSGRFSRYLDVGAASNVMGIAHRQVSPHLANVVERVPGTTGASRYAAGVSESDKEKAGRHQAQFEQADRYAKELAAAYPGPTNGVTLEVQVLRGDGKQDTITVALNTLRGGRPLTLPGLNALDDTILSVNLGTSDASRDVVDAVARFNAAGAVGDDTLARLTGPSQADWAQALAGYDTTSRDKTRLTQLFGNLQGAGNVLRAIPGGEKAGNFAALVGSMGPDAEKVLGPHVRRAAYRYRGTEKTPDKELRDEVNRLERARGPVRQGIDTLDLPTQDEKAILKPAEGAINHRRGKANGDEFNLQVTGDVVAAHLAEKLPKDPIQAQLSEQAGHVLPSQGVLLDDQGRIVSQAVGYADDHYLPFDLKNLARLRGGQYVRTRVQGGLTGEDIYAAVQSGARRVTVVSTSGVYSLELDPTFRGARANSDKARAMYTRYLQILDAVQAKNLYLQDLPGSEKDKARSKARLLNPDLSGDALDAAEEAAVIQARRDATMLTDEKRKELEAAAEAQARQDFPTASQQELARNQEEIYEELKERAFGDRVAPLALNGPGYNVALQTLQQQFPYFIRKVEYEPLTGRAGSFFGNRQLDETDVRGLGRTRARDRGYVRPGGIRPAGVAQGFYNPSGPQVPFKEPVRREEPRATTEGPAPESGGSERPEAAEAVDSGAAAPAAAATSPLRRRLETLSVQANTNVAEHAQTLSQVMRRLTRTPNSGEGENWASVAGSQDATYKLQVLLNKASTAPAEFATLVRRPEVLALLDDRESLRSAFNAVYGGLLEDAVEGMSANERQLVGGASDAQEFENWVVDQAAEISEWGHLTDPFGPASTDPFHAGDRPQPYPDLMRLDTEAAYKAFTEDGPGAQLKATADELFGHARGGYAPMAASQLRAAKTLADLAKIRDALPGFLREGQRDLANYTPARLATLSAVSEADMAKALGAPVTAENLNELTAGIGRRAEQVQRAWSLHQVERSLQALESGGVVRPKAGEGVFKASWSRRGRVVDPNSSLARAVRKAHSEGRLPRSRSLTLTE